jgi:hypothetical protein
MQRSHTNFEVALAAHEGKIKPEDLKGAAKVIYNLYNHQQLSGFVNGVVSKKKTLYPSINRTQGGYKG